MPPRRACSGSVCEDRSRRTMTKTLDCRAQQCPMPIVELSIAVRDMQPGDRIVVEATDPAFEPDIRAWAEMTGHSLEGLEIGEVLRATITVR